MIELYFSFLGEYAMLVVEFYRRYALVLNAIVVLFGVCLTVAHRNTLRVEAFLREHSDKNDMRAIVAELQERPLTPGELTEIRSSLRFPVISSTWHLFFYTITQDNIVKVLRRKYGGYGRS
ncbi:MAG: hypothetical protein EA383_03930 [Spirochaetaceae bacterium]|nr:MAG: hypothetical protein EA383_03930 [Spirochaetaceae bacterium]